jgi:hypothetical protein
MTVLCLEEVGNSLRKDRVGKPSLLAEIMVEIKDPFRSSQV